MDNPATYSSVTETFGELYVKLRAKEKRIYTDEQVQRLPLISNDHLHYKEWVQRKISAERLVKYLKKNDRPLQILEVGCGNGWLSAFLAIQVNARVMGIDMNHEELEQAKRVFQHIPGLQFHFGNIQSVFLQDQKFDIILFAASIQYFPSLEAVLRTSLQHLKEKGEVHIIDSMFYRRGEVGAAKQRSKEYYASLGFPEMANNYFHHCIDELKQFEYNILFDPLSLKNRFSRFKTPFYWIAVENK